MFPLLFTSFFTTGANLYGSRGSGAPKNKMRSAGRCQARRIPRVSVKRLGARIIFHCNFTSTNMLHALLSRFFIFKRHRRYLLVFFYFLRRWFVSDRLQPELTVITSEYTRLKYNIKSRVTWGTLTRMLWHSVVSLCKKSACTTRK